MKLNIKYFLLGALIASVPVGPYAYKKLTNQKPATASVLAGETENGQPIQPKSDQVQLSNTSQVDIKSNLLADQKLVQFLELNLTEPEEQSNPASPEAEVKTEPPELVEPEPTTTPERATEKHEPQPQVPVVVNAENQDTNVHWLIAHYAGEYGVDPNMMTHIANCESGFRNAAVNGPYGGIYQFLASTWAANRRAMGEDANPDLRFDAEEAVKTAAFKMARDGYGAWPVCQQKARVLLSYESENN